MKPASCFTQLPIRNRIIQFSIQLDAGWHLDRTDSFESFQLKMGNRNNLLHMIEYMNSVIFISASVSIMINNNSIKQHSKKLKLDFWTSPVRTRFDKSEI